MRVEDSTIAAKIESVCRNPHNQAGIRLLLSCTLAKVHNPSLDIRKPYTKIGGEDSYSGRTYDEAHIGPFITRHQLPCNPTTAFLTPALRNRNIVLTPDVDLVGRPPELYRTVLGLLDDIHHGRVSAKEVLTEAIRWLLVIKEERRDRIEGLIRELELPGSTPLSSESIVSLIAQHLKCRGASRLPVLVVAAAYRSAVEYLRERALPLRPHNAADERTGALGDIEITLVNDDKVVTSYEMKMKRVTQGDIDRALQKIVDAGKRVDNYIFITTEVVDPRVAEYAASVYEKTGGIEVAILDCIGSLRHFLHLFHRLRTRYLSAYQELVLAEPESAVGHPLKEAFLALRRVAESGE